MKNSEVIILHGWAIGSQNEAKWATFRAVLSAAGIRSNFLAIPGLDTQLDEPWTVAKYVAWLDSQLSEDKKYIVLGHSFGGQLAVRYAALYPEKIAKLILIAPSGIRDYSIRARFKRGIFLVLAKMGKVFTSHPLCRRVLYMLAREHDYEQAGPVMKKTMRLVTLDEIREDIVQITCPVQLVWGRLDTSTPYTNSALFLKALPEASLCSIPSARHSPQFTHPKEAAHCIIEFIRKE